MTSLAIREKLYNYIRVAEDKKVKAIYTMLENEIEEVHDYWNDESFVQELDNRSADYKSGKDKGILWDVAKKEILDSSKKKKK